MIKDSQMAVDPYAELKVPESSYIEGHQLVPVGGIDLITGSLFSPSVPSLTGRATQVRKSTNPFDLPYDPDSEVIFVVCYSLLEAKTKLYFLKEKIVC